MPAILPATRGPGAGDAAAGPGGVAGSPLPGPVIADLGVRTVRRLTGGGSPATVWLAEPASGPPVVVKLLRDGPGRVDGHDLGSFRAKAAQLRWLHQRAHGLSPFLVPVLADWAGAGWAAYAMPVVAGRPLCAALDGSRPDEAGFATAVARVFGVLGRHGYLHDAGPAPADHFAATHLARLSRRLPLLRRHVDPALLGSAPVRVNGRPVPGLAAAVARLAGRSDLLAALRPARLAPPVHGDLNLGNVLVADPAARRFTVLDPRGTLRPWDPVYDLAKALFSLTLFEPALRSGFAVTAAPGAGYRVRLRTPAPAYHAAAAGFPDLLAGLPLGRELDRVDSGWRLRLLVGHAVHCLAEASCRLSDATPRQFGPRRGWAARVELATGLLLAGLTLLADLLTARRPAAPTDHLGVLRPFQAGPDACGRA